MAMTLLLWWNSLVLMMGNVRPYCFAGNASKTFYAGWYCFYKCGVWNPASLITRRTGYADDFYLWRNGFRSLVFMNLRVRDSNKRSLNCHQFSLQTPNSIQIIVVSCKDHCSKEYVVGSGGMQMAEQNSDNNGKDKTLTYRAEDCGFRLDRLAWLCCIYRPVGKRKDYASSSKRQDWTGWKTIYCSKTCDGVLCQKM